MRRRQVVYRSLPHRQTAYESFFSMVAGKYGTMQRRANKLLLTHRLIAAPNRHRKPSSAALPLHVQVAVPGRTVETVREVIREQPVYRARPVPIAHPVQRVQREQPVMRERIVERKETVVRERIVEKQVVVVREAERLIREQQQLRELAMTQPPQGSDAGTAPATTPRGAPTGKLPALEQRKPSAGTRSQQDSSQQDSGLMPEVPEKRLSMDGQSAAQGLSSATQRTDNERKRLDASDASIDKNDSQVNQAGRAGAQHKTTHERSARQQAIESAESIVASRSQLVQMMMQNQSWPLAVARKSGWRIAQPPAAEGKSSAVQPPGRSRKTRQSKQRSKGKAGRPDAVQRKVQMPSWPSPVTLMYRKTASKEDATQRLLWRAVPVMRTAAVQPPSIADQPGRVDAADRQTTAAGDHPELTVRAVIASRTRLQQLHPLIMQHRQASRLPVVHPHQHEANDATRAQQGAQDSASAALSPSSQKMPRTARFDRLQIRLMRQQAVDGRASFLQGDALQERIVSMQLQRSAHHLLSAEAEHQTEQSSLHADSRQARPSRVSVDDRSRSVPLDHARLTPDRALSVQPGQKNKQKSPDRGMHSTNPALTDHDGHTAKQAPTDYDEQATNQHSSEHDGHTAIQEPSVSFGQTAKPVHAPGATEEVLPVIRLRRSSKLGRWPAVMPVHARKRHPLAIQRTPAWMRGTPDDPRQQPTFTRLLTGMERSVALHAKQESGRSSLVHRARGDRQTDEDDSARPAVSPVPLTLHTADGRDSSSLPSDASVSMHAAEGPLGYESQDAAAQRRSTQADGDGVTVDLHRSAAGASNVRLTGAGRQPLYRSDSGEQDNLSRRHTGRLMPQAQPLVPLIMRSTGGSKHAGTTLVTAQHSAIVQRPATMQSSATMQRTAAIQRIAAAQRPALVQALRAAPHAGAASAAGPIRQGHAQPTVLREVASTAHWMPQRLPQQLADAADSNASVEADERYEQMFPLAYAVAGRSHAAQGAQTGLTGPAVQAQAAGPAASIFTATDGERNFAPMELRRQSSQPPAASRQPESHTQNSSQPSIDPEQLQQAIGKLSTLNPDQIAEQVYRALAKRLRFERRLQGF